MKTCGVLLSTISERFDTIIEFTAFENFISFERKSKNKVKRIENNKIKVTIEVEGCVEYYDFDIENVNKK